MSKAHNQFNNARVEESVVVEPISNNQPTFSQTELDAIVAKAVEKALAAQATQAAAQATQAAAQATQAAAQAAAAEAAKKAETEKAAAAEKAKVEPTKTVPKEGDMTISEKEYKALQKRQTINNYFGGSDFNSTKSSDDEINPWVVGGIAIGFVALVAGVYYWVLKD